MKALHHGMMWSNQRGDQRQSNGLTIAPIDLTIESNIQEAARQVLLCNQMC